MVGKQGSPSAPNLDRVWERLRPDWTARWLASPQRMYAYNAVMPVNFPKEKNPDDKEDLFHGSPIQQIMAVRDALMDYPRISSLPINRYYRPVSAGGK